MGISLVCGLGPGFSEYRHGPCGPGVCQAPIDADHAGMVYETRWADPGLRMEFQRCQPAGPGLGGPDGLPDREGANGQGGYRFSEADLPEAADQFHLVDQPEGCQWQQYVRRRVPRTG